MNKIITLALAYLVSSVAITTPSIAQEADKYLFRYNSTSGGAAVTPPEEEEDDSISLISPEDSVMVLDYIGNDRYGSSVIEIFGNGQYSGKARVLLFAKGFTSAPVFSSGFEITDDIYSAVNFLEDGSPFGIDGSVYYTMPTINIPYSFNGTNATFTATADGKSARTTIPIMTTKFDYGPLRLDTSNFPSLINAAPPIEYDEFEQPVSGNNENDTLRLQGGVPPYRVTINTNDIDSRNNDYFSSSYNSSVIENALAIEIDRVLHQYTYQNDPNTRVDRNINPLIAWRNCTAPGVTSTETDDVRYSITVTDATGASVTSPQQTVRYFSDRPGCFSLNWQLKPLPQ